MGSYEVVNKRKARDSVKVKDAIKVLQDNYNLEQDIFFDVYSRNDLDYLGDDIKSKITDEMMTAIFETMDSWATTDDFNDAVRIVLSENGVDA